MFLAQLYCSIFFSLSFRFDANPVDFFDFMSSLPEEDLFDLMVEETNRFAFQRELTRYV